MFNLEITEPALKGLNQYFAENEKSTLRIFMTPGGCSGPYLALGLDDLTEDDEMTEENGYTFCINKDLLSTTGKVSIDSNGMGFAVVSENALRGGGCGNCAGSCHSGWDDEKNDNG